MKRQSSKSSSKSSSKKVKYTFDTKSDTIFSDEHTHKGVTSKFNLIDSSKEPFYKYTWQDKEN